MNGLCNVANVVFFITMDYLNICLPLDKIVFILNSAEHKICTFGFFYIYKQRKFHDQLS